MAAPRWACAWGLRAPAARPRGVLRRARRLAQLRMMEEIECDVVIVGGGPAGCTCALYTARADHKTVIVDKNPTVGALAITNHIANYPGVDKAALGAESALVRRRIQRLGA